MNAPNEKASFYGVNTALWTHINLLTGRKGRVVEQLDGEVVMQDEKGIEVNHIKSRLHLTWAPLNSESQGEQA